MNYKSLYKETAFNFHEVGGERSGKSNYNSPFKYYYVLHVFNLIVDYSATFFYSRFVNGVS